MFESLTALLHSNEEDERAQGLLLLSSLEPKSNEELTNAFTKVIDECTIEDGKLTAGSWLESCEYKYRMQTAMYILHYLQSPKQKDIVWVNLFLLGDTLPPLPYIESLTIIQDNDRSTCNPKVEITTELPSVHTLRFGGFYGSEILHIPKVNVPRLRLISVSGPLILDGLFHYTHATELEIMCVDFQKTSSNVQHYMTEHDIAIPSVHDWYERLQSYLNQTSLSALDMSIIDKHEWDSITIPKSVTSLRLQGDYLSIINLHSLTSLEQLTLNGNLQNAAELLPFSLLKDVTLKNTAFLPPLIPTLKEAEDNGYDSRFGKLEFDGEKWLKLLAELQAYLDISQNGVESLVQSNKLLLGYNSLLQNLQGFESNDVEDLNLDWADNLHTLDGLNMPNLRRLSLRGCRDLDFSALKDHPTLEAIDLTNSDLRSLGSLPSIPNLHTILLDNSNVVTLGEANLSTLRTFSAADAICLQDISALQTATLLEQLNLNQCVNIEDLSLINRFTGLKELYMQGTMVSLFPDIRDCRQLETLVVKHSPYLKGFAGLPECNIEELNLSWCGCFEDTQSLLPLRKLKYLNLAWCRFVEDIAPLQSMTQLEQLVFWKNDALPLDLTDHNLRGKQIQQVLRQNELLIEGTTQIPNWREALKSESIDEIATVLNEILEYPNAVVHQLLEGCSIDNSDLHAWEGFESPFKYWILFTLFSKSAHPAFIEAKVLVLNNTEGLRTLNGIEKASQVQAVLIGQSTTLTDISALGKLHKFRRGLDNAFIRPQLFLHNLQNVQDFSCLEKMQSTELELWKLPHLTDGTQFGQMTGGYGLMKLRVIECGVVDLGDLSALEYLQEYRVESCPALESLGLHNFAKPIPTFQYSDCPNLRSLEGLNIADPTMIELSLINMPNLTSLTGVPESLTTLKVEGCKITDFESLGTLSSLQSLTINQKSLCLPADVFKQMTQLTSLHLETITSETPSAEVDLREVIHSPDITSIHIVAPKITGLEAIHTLNNLSTLTLVGPEDDDKDESNPLNVLLDAFSELKNLLELLQGNESEQKLLEHSYDFNTVSDISPLKHLPVAKLHLSSLSSSDDLSDLVHFHRDKLEHVSNIEDLEINLLRLHGTKLTFKHFTDTIWPEIPVCDGVEHLSIGTNEELNVDNKIEPIVDLRGLQGFPNLKTLALYQCTSLKSISEIDDLSQLQALMFKNSFSGHMFTKSGLVGMYSDIVEHGVQVTGFVTERNDDLQVGDILIANEHGMMKTRDDFPKVKAGQGHRFTILRNDQEMQLDVDFYDVRTLKAGEHDWLICDTLVIQQFLTLIQDLDNQEQQIVWIHKNDDWDLEAVRNHLFQHFEFSPFSTSGISTYSASRVVVGFADIEKDLSSAVSQAPEGLTIEFCPFGEFALHM